MRCALIASNTKELNDKSITRLAKKRESLEVVLSELRREVRAHRDGHSKAVRKALQPTIEAAARAIIATLAEFNAAATVLNSCESEFDQAGGEARYVRLGANFGAIEHHARSLLEELNP
jgi:hypothetical protein